MRLTDLDAELVRWEERPHPNNYAAEGFDCNTPEGIAAWEAAGRPRAMQLVMPHVETLAEAQGVMLDCPKCRNHSVIIAFADRGVKDNWGTRSSDGRPTRWQVVGGTGLNDLTLSPSIDCTPSNPNCWHGFITNGEVT